jgi:thiaminase (transcriptional activator TenA)
MPAKEEWIMLARLSFFKVAAPSVTFVAKLLKTQPIANNLTSIYTHTFNQQLFAGTLNTHSFGKYLHDDSIYLHHYARALNKLAVRVNDSHRELALHLSDLSGSIIAGEQGMQEQYQEYFTATPGSKPGEAISAYIKFLNEHAEKAPTPVALCSILPCFWVYAQLGAQKMHPAQLVHNPYREWIATYSDPGFVKATETLVATVNQLAEQTDAKEQEQMEKAFSDAVVFELQFFNEVEPKHALVLKI